jgi:hypothetical protein
MPWRLILCILILALVLGFIGFNLENRCDISFGPRGIKALTISQAPVYLTVFTSFILGMLCSLPLVISFRPKKAKGPEKPKKGRTKDAPADPPPLPPADDGTYGID